MQNGIHFISGLPRSGSTLLAALLRQNPRFHAEMSSPVCPLYLQLQTGMSGKAEFHPFFDEARRISMLRGLFTSYYSGTHEHKLVFDTSRAWCGKLSGLVKLFPSSKVICCVRATSWILDSIERLVQRNAYEPSRIFNFEANGTVYSRVEMLTRPGGLVRASYDNLREGFYGANATRLLLVTYESLAARPIQTLKTIYEFINEPWFEHDAEHVEYSADEFDTKLGAPGLHRVSGKVQLVERPTILPPDIFEKFKDTAFWADPKQNPYRVAVV